MEKTSPMIVPVREVPCHRELELATAFLRAVVEAHPMRQALERPADDPDAGAATASLDFYSEGENVFARGNLRGWVEVACSRCVGPVRIPIDETLHVTYLPRAMVPEEPAPTAEPEEEVELSEEDLDVYPYDNQEIDLEPLLREQVILAVPFAPLCDEECKGLCPVCGVDRNRETCECEAPIDPRLAALKDIKF